MVYFLCSAMMALLLFLVCGAVGFLACRAFLLRIYRGSHFS